MGIVLVDPALHDPLANEVQIRYPFLVSVLKPDELPKPTAPLEWARTEWSPGRIDLRPLRRAVVGRTAVSVLFLLGFFEYLRLGPGIDPAFAGVFLAVLAAVATVGLGFYWRFAREDLIRKNGPMVYTDKPPIAEVKIEREGIELGRDSGVLWADGPLLRFEGLGTHFAVSNRTLLEGDPNSDVVRIRIGDVEWTIRLGFGSVTNRGPIFSEIRRWKSASNPEADAESQIPPPVDPQTRATKWFVTKAVESMTWQRAIIVLMLVGLEIASRTVGAEKYARLCALSFVGMVHLVWSAYRTVRRKDETDRLRLRTLEEARIENLRLRLHGDCDDDSVPQDGNLTASRVVT